MTQTSEASVVGRGTAELSAERTPEARRAPGGAARKPRDPHLDNAKFLAILLVAAAHGLAGMKDVRLGAVIWTFCYMFHMPVFLVISGYLSKRFSFTDERVIGLVGSTLAPYLIFQSGYALFAWAAGERKFQFDLLDPYYVTWFLLALFVWRLLTPMWRRLKYPLATAVLVCLLAYMGDMGNTLDIYRILGLLPFYVLGLRIGPEVLVFLRRPPVRIAGAVTLVAGFGVAYLTHDRMNNRWLFWNTSNADMGVDELTGTMMRIGLLLTATVLLMAFLAVTPSRRTWYTDLGTATLYGYLLHGFFTRFFAFQGWNKVSWIDSVPGVLLVVAVCFVLVTVLCTAPVRKVTRWAVEPDLRALFTRK
ncbi:membrane protein [Actinomadura sp. NBRC 104412]|uniref:acyltransferase family protein n=1 Tax=Actinomadura sp. NBRC 104412 TaxID=3032203 RepID=UPI00249FAFCA|nr:acyltransferase family protein [Actinomadura sp. NBRC 104412]GLZ09061.1 membrane protein [Actinomadura sp. NBRC 104412]